MLYNLCIRLMIILVNMDENSYRNILDDADPDLNHYDDYVVNFMSYDIDSLKNNIKLDNGFNVLHHNSRSLLAEGRLTDYGILLESIDNPFHILGLTETWLKPNNANNVEIEGFEYIHSIRPTDSVSDKESGGGLSFFIKQGVEYKVCEHLNSMEPYMESLFLEVTRNSKTYLVGLIYRIPNTNVDLFIDKMNEIIEPIRNKQELILLGDFNIDLLQDNSYSNDFQNMLLSNYLVPTVLEPTRVASVMRNNVPHISETLIDNIFVNTNIDFKSGLIHSSITDHYPVFVSIDEYESAKIVDAPKTIKIRLIDDFKIRKFKSALHIAFSNSLQDVTNAQLAFTNYFKIFNSLYDKYFPTITKQVKVKSLLKPWVSDSLIQRIKIRDSLARKFNKGGIDREIYTRFRNKLTAQLRIAKSNYYKSEFLKCNGNSKKTWSIINSNIKKTVKSTDVKLKENENMVEASKVPNKLINYFTTVVNDLTSKVPKSDKNAAYYLRNRNVKSFSMFPVVVGEVESAISQLKNTNAVMSISSAVLEEVSSTISPYLTDIFNSCIHQGYFPRELKLGRITPVHKKGCKLSTMNYRPICNLSPFSKIFERIMYNRMLDFIKKCNIFSSAQFGFQKDMGTENALIEFVEYIQIGLTKRNNVGSIFMDLSKAFDVMDHSILKVKLEHYGFRGIFLDLLMDFLKDRQYYVFVNGFKSETKTVNIGVPQGSTLGPLFFLLFVNDMKNCSHLLKFIQFADDTTILFSCPDINNLNINLEIESNKVVKWFNSNKLIINFSKTNCMLFSNKRDLPKLDITLNNNKLDVVNETSFLGVVIDNKLTWKAHVKHICKKISKSVAILRFVKYSFPKNALRLIYMSLIFSHINYCNLIWGSAYKTTLDPLFKLQKKAVRLVNKSGYLDHTEPIFLSLRILTVQKVFMINCVKFIFKCITSSKFPEYRIRLKKNSDISPYNTRGKNLLRPPRERLELCRNSFFVRGINLWNLLDDECKLSMNIFQFKRNVKCMMFDGKFPNV